MTLFFIPPMLGIINYPELMSLDGTFNGLGTGEYTICPFIYRDCSQWIERKEIALMEKERKGGIRS